MTSLTLDQISKFATTRIEAHTHTLTTTLYPANGDCNDIEYKAKYNPCNKSNKGKVITPAKNQNLKTQGVTIENNTGLIKF